MYPRIRTKTVYLLVTGLLRHMRSVNVECPNFLDTTDSRFASFHNALDNVLHEFREKGIGAQTQRTEAFTKADEESLWQSGVLGIDNPKSLLYTVLYMNGKNLCLRGGEEQRQLKLSQFQRLTNPLRYVYTENASKNRCGGLAQIRVENKVVPIIAIGPRCHVKILDSYFEKLPPKAFEKDNFYVQPSTETPDDPNKPWYTANPIGRNTLGKFVKEICDKGNIDGHKTNHSLCATGVSDLFKQEYQRN